jgi:hypothetical protein
MATIGTTTASTAGISSAFGYPPNPCMDLNVKTGELWICFRDQANRAAIYKSVDNGVSWSFQANFTAAGWTLEDICSMRIDAQGLHMHIIMLASNGTNEAGLYKRVAISSGSPDTSSGVLTFSGPAGSSQSFEFTGGLVPVVNPDGSIHVFIAFAQVGTTVGITVYALTVRNDAGLTSFVNNAIIGPTRIYKVSSSDTSLSCSVDVEHNGDGITSASPNVWATWITDTQTYVIRCVWKGYKQGWQTPSAASKVSSGSMSERDNPAVWDGQRYLIIRPAPGALNTMQIFERKADNTGDAVVHQTPNHPNGTMTGAKAISYNYVTKDFRVYAIGSGGDIYYIDYTRASNTFGSWTDTGLNPVGSEWGLRRGTYGTAQYDMYYETGASSPWTVSNGIWAVNFAPNAPTWVTGTAGTVSVSGAAFDASVSLTLDWNFSDPNTTDSQSQFALSRQIGAGTVQWWRTSDSTWQTVETFNSSGTSALTLPTANWLGGGGASDPAHIYKVAVKDSGGLVSAYSAGLAIVPSARVDPTLTAPTTGSTLNVGNVALTWTVTEQSAYRVVIINTVTSATVYDSGFLSDPTPNSPSVLSYTVPVALASGFAGQVQFTTKNVEGLSSTTRTANFTITYVEPVAPIVTALAAAPASGGISVTVTQAAATGTQPATSQLNIWRRKSLTGTLVAANANPFFETNASDWTSVNYSTIARSTSQFHSGVASLLCTPTGAAATPKAQTTALYPVTAGSRYEFRGWLRSTTANKTMRVYIDWYDNTPTLLSSTTRDLTPVTTTWIWAWVRGTAPAGATQARIAVGQLATPAAGDTLFADDLQLLAANDDAGIRIVAGAVSGTAYLDWRAVTGVDYEYQGFAQGSNGTTSNGPWQD